MNRNLIIVGNFLLAIGFLLGFIFWRLSTELVLQKPIEQFVLAYLDATTSALLVYGAVLSAVIGYIMGYLARTHEDIYGALVPSTFFLIVIGWYLYSSSIGYVFEHLLNMTALAVYFLIIIAGFLGGELRRVRREYVESTFSSRV